MAGLARNVTDSAGRNGMDSSPRLSHPWTTSSFTQYTVDKDKVCCTQVVSRSQETTDDKLPMYLYLYLYSATALIVMLDEHMSRQAVRQDLTQFLYDTSRAEEMTINRLVIYLKGLVEKSLHVSASRAAFKGISRRPQTSDISHKR